MCVSSYDPFESTIMCVSSYEPFESLAVVRTEFRIQDCLVSTWADRFLAGRSCMLVPSTWPPREVFLYKVIDLHIKPNDFNYLILLVGLIC